MINDYDNDILTEKLPALWDIMTRWGIKAVLDAIRTIAETKDIEE